MPKLPYYVSSEATKTCDIFVGNNLSYSSYLGEESVPDGEKIISHSSFNLNILLRLSFSNSENSIVAF
jgi:hypothetical protein